MTQFSKRIADLGWTAEYISHRLGIQVAQGQRWLSGEEKIPPTVRAWVNTLWSFHLEHQQPLGWEVTKEIEQRRSANREKRGLRIVK